MELRLEEISKIICSQIKHYESTVEHDETGSVVLVGDGIARVSGLDKCEVNELVEFPNGEYGMALNLEEDTVAVVLLAATWASARATPCAARDELSLCPWARP